MALLSLLSGMPGCNLVACHVNHQLRPEAEEEEMFVLRYAASWVFPVSGNASMSAVWPIPAE